MERLGQHFLKNKSALKKIVEALELKSGDIAVEIGAGHGELTNELLASSFELLEKWGGAIKIVAVEKDKNLVEVLREKFTKEKNVEVVEGDALKILPQLTKSLKLKAKGYKVVGNIPYYITGHLFRVVGELEHGPELCVFTIQKEVAERITAVPPKMNRLAASVRFWTEPKIIMRLPKGNFEPPPKVDSAIVRLKVKGGKLKVENEKYYETVRMLFAQPRKTILNNLEAKRRDRGALEGAGTKEEIAHKLREIGINPEDRPQNLRVEDIIKIAAAFRF